MAAEILLKNGADWLYSGRQKTTPFAVINRKKNKSLIQVLKEYVSTKKFKELEFKSRSLGGFFVDLRETAFPQIVEFSQPCFRVLDEGMATGAILDILPPKKSVSEIVPQQLAASTNKGRPLDTQKILSLRIDPVSIEKLEIHQQIRDKKNQIAQIQKVK